MGHNRNLADYAHHFDGTHIDLGTGNIETQGVVTYEDVTNVDAIGIITARTGVKVPDNQKIFLGTGDDLQIYHNGSDSFITDNIRHLIVRAEGSGDLYLQSDNKVILSDVGGNETFIECNDNGNVSLYYDNSKKFETTTTGATVTGTLVSDGVTSELDLSAISSSISDTAKDIFVYDTRKDSDGGAWRKRTQNTSWYNETLNTSTRGSRKEFPAVAVIVSTSSGVTIYDGDDPDLPMWMVFEDTVSDMINTHNVSPSSFSLSALNANVLVGSRHPSYGEANVINFISDNGVSYYSAHSGDYNGSISQRNDGLSQSINSNYGTLVNSVVNDLAMTVLPNAPIDDTTGLPIPTIAVATGGGVSVIKDDGTVSSSAGDAAGLVEYLDNNYLVITRDNNAGYFAVHNNHFTSGSWNANANSYYSATIPAFNQSGYINGLAASENGYFGNDIGVHIYDALSSSSTNTNGLFSNITASYNTGYMVGDIKGAFLSDTDTTSAVAVYYDNFSNNDKGWGFVNTSISGGNMVITQQSQARSTDGDALNGIATGTKLVFTFTVSGSGTGDVVIDDDGAGAGQGGTTNYGSFSSTGSYTFTATKTGSPRIRIMRNNGSNDYNINFLNISTEYDRSINNKGLGVYGTITKSAVATGAELVAYSGFSASNYLEQPYNSSYNFGSNSFSVMGWFKTNSSSGAGTIVCRGTSDSDETFRVYLDNATYGVYFDYGSGSQYSYLSNAADKTAIYNQNWNHFVCHVTAGGEVKIYVNGVSKTLTIANPPPSTFSSTNTNILRIGCTYNGGQIFPGSAALVRVSASIPSPEQVKKMYEDEKVLFQENAKATLYGSSDAVTALGYDEDTELLHVGTSAGRSDFQGLRRINNTTTAVTTAISASDELIAEQ